jgi:hypothetical protein
VYVIGLQLIGIEHDVEPILQLVVRNSLLFLLFFISFPKILVSLVELFEHFIVKRDDLVLVNGLLVHTVHDIDDLEEGLLLAASQPFLAVHQRRPQSPLLLQVKLFHVLVEVSVHDVAQLADGAADDRCQHTVVLV